MTDTSKDGLLLSGGIRHIIATSQLERGSKQVPACVGNIYCLNAFIFSNISSPCANEYLVVATCYCQVEVKIRDRIAVVMSEIINRNERHFPVVS